VTFNDDLPDQLEFLADQAGALIAKSIGTLHLSAGDPDRLRAAAAELRALRAVVDAIGDSSRLRDVNGNVTVLEDADYLDRVIVAVDDYYHRRGRQ